jgi:predicted LPLAT superfamily acyltransferase/uncharacterized membrane protein
MLGLGLLGVLAARIAIGLRPGSLAHARPLLVQLLPVAGVIALAVVLDDSRFILALPVFINLALLGVFARSLTGEVSIVERIARLQDPDLTSAEAAHCTQVTRVWCGFFLLNAGVIAALAVTATLAWWTLYTALLSYLLMGALFAGEFVLRRHRFRRFGEGPVDRMLHSLLPARATDASGAPNRALDWTQIAEKGSVLGLRALLFVSVTVGRTAVRAAMRVVAAYYLLTDARVRRVSREFHERVGVAATTGTIYRHIRCFAFCASDRIFLLRGEAHRFRFVRTGQEHAVRVHRAGKGGIVIGAHLGSFEALRAAAEHDDLPMSIVGYFGNAAMINAMLDSLDPTLSERVIPVEPGHVGHVLKIRARLRAGELVAFLGDRPIPGGETVQVDFLGRPAQLPTGALSIAAALGCPVLLVFSLYRDPNVYEIHCEEFAERIELPRKGGLEQKRAWVQRYADRLAHYARLAPENWANFYDFWDEASEGD